MEAIYTFAKNVGEKTLQRQMYESIYSKRTKNDERKRVGQDFGRKFNVN